MMKILKKDIVEAGDHNEAQSPRATERITKLSAQATSTLSFNGMNPIRLG